MAQALSFGSRSAETASQDPRVPSAPPPSGPGRTALAGGVGHDHLRLCTILRHHLHPDGYPDAPRGVGGQLRVPGQLRDTVGSEALDFCTVRSTRGLLWSVGGAEWRHLHCDVLEQFCRFWTGLRRNLPPGQIFCV